MIVSEPPSLKGGIEVLAQGATSCLSQWLEAERESLLKALTRSGAMLLRGFAHLSLNGFEEVATCIAGQPLEPYENRSTPRTSVKERIFTSTEYPPSETIPLHNENSYSSRWPAFIFFLCVKPADAGGETPIADSRRVYETISPRTRALFESKGITYVRNYGDLGLSWQETFQTDRREVVEEYCRRYGIRWEWREDSRLCTRQVLPATRRHPLTGEPSWFNQAHLFHVSNLGRVGEELLELFGAERVPRNALFGDGSAIDIELLEEIRSAYEVHAAPVAWRENDLLALDNVLFAHGRRPFSGSRLVLVAMGGLQGGVTVGLKPHQGG